MFAAPVNPAGMGRKRKMSFGLSPKSLGRGPERNITLDSLEKNGDGSASKNGGCCYKLTSVYQHNKYSLGGFFLVFSYFLVGGLYYCFGPMQMSFVNFMYFAVSIMTTVGYGDLDIVLNKGDKWFTSIYAVSGLSLLSCIVSLAIHAGTPDGAETTKELLEETTSKVTCPETGKRLSEQLGFVEEKRVSTRLERMCAWMRRNTRDIFMLVTLVSLIGVGCAFFVVNNGMDFTDAFYLCIITATTIGLGDLSPGMTKGICGIDGLCANKGSLNSTCIAHEDCSQESIAGKWFGVFFMMLSVMGLTGAIGRLSDVLGRKKFKEKIDKSLSKLEISEELFEFVDADSDGNIDKSEWFAACVKRLELLDPIFYQIIEDNFAKLDVTGDGAINKDDVKELLRKRNSVSLEETAAGTKIANGLLPVNEEEEEEEEDEERVGGGRGRGRGRVGGGGGGGNGSGVIPDHGHGHSRLVTWSAGDHFASSSSANALPQEEVGRHRQLPEDPMGQAPEFDRGSLPPINLSRSSSSLYPSDPSFR